MKNITLLFALLIWSCAIHAQGSPENDLTLSAVAYANYQPDTDTNYRNLEYSIYHISQIRPLTLKGTATNSGSNSQTGVQLKAVVNNNLGYSEILFSDTFSLAPGMEQEIQIPNYLPPTQIASYSIYYELMSDSLDANPADNFGEKEFEISAHYFARDRGVSEGGFTDFQGEYILGKFFHAEEQPNGEVVSLYCVHFVLSDLSDPGAFVEVVILDFNFDYLGGSSPIAINESSFSSIGEGIFVSLCLDYVFPLFSGEDYFVGIRNYGGPNDAVVAVENEVEANSAFLINNSPVSVNVNPIIRLGVGNLCESDPWCLVPGIESNVQQVVTNLYPNPATDQLTLEYTLLESTPLEIRISDVNGRVVHHENTGKLPVGEHRSTFNIQHLPAGIYALNITADGEVVSNKFVVQR